MRILLHAANNLDLLMGTVPEWARYHGSLARTWRSGYKRGGFLKRLKFIRHQLRGLVACGDCWLDAGCESGVLTDELALLGARGYAVDASEEMITEARLSALSAKDAFEFQPISSVEQLVFPDQLFDDVLCSSVIEYLERPELVFREFHRVLRKDGRLFVSVANRYSVVRNAQRAIRPVARETGRDVFRYLGQVRVLHSEKGIARDLAASGFSIENIQFFDPFLPQFVWPVAPPALIFVTSLRL